MTPLTLVVPEPEAESEQLDNAALLPLPDGNGTSQSPQAVPPDSELQNRTEAELKAAIKLTWKKHEPLAKKGMAPLLYWLRVKLRAPGSRNDIHDKDRGFGAWVDEHLDISRATADRWADEYAREKGLKPEPTSPHVRRGCEDPDFYKRKLAKRSKGITLWVKEPLRDQYWHALDAIKKHFNITDNGEAVVKGLCYAAKTIARPVHGRTRARHASAVGRRKR
jgi:hypothetical protein